MAARVARERGTTYILMGTPERRAARWQRLSQPALPFELLRALPGVDLRIVADRTQRPEARPMTALHDRFSLIVLVVVVVACDRARARRPRAEARRPPSSTRILFPFVAQGLSQRGLDAALRLARIEGATLVPVFLARVPLHLPLDAALPRQCDSALPLLEAIEQRAVRSRRRRSIRGSSAAARYRHALREIVDARAASTPIVVAAVDATELRLSPRRHRLAARARPGRDHRDPLRRAHRFHADAPAGAPRAAPRVTPAKR